MLKKILKFFAILIAIYFPPILFIYFVHKGEIFKSFDFYEKLFLCLFLLIVFTTNMLIISYIFIEKEKLNLRNKKLNKLNEIRKEINHCKSMVLEKTETTEETSNNQVINKSTKNTKTYGSLYKNIIESIVDI